MPLTQKRKNEIKNTVLSVLKASDIHTLPVRINDIVQAYAIQCLPMDRYAQRGPESASGEDGFVFRQKQGYLIVYNTECSPVRIRWTLAYQLGHIFLKHLDAEELSAGRADDEANYFAKELLAPLSVLDKLGARTAQQIAQVCNISFQAASIRSRDFMRRDAYYKKYGNTDYDERFLSQFSVLFAPKNTVQASE